MKTALTWGLLTLAVPALGADQSPSIRKHDFLYCGEWQKQSLDNQSIYLVRDGRVTWTYTSPIRGEVSDCTLLANGNILIARQFGAAEIAPDKTRVWTYDAPPKTELHTIVQVDDRSVAVIENGHPALLKVIHKADNHIINSFQLQTSADPSVHGQFRRLRMLPSGHFLIAHHDLDKVVEYDSDGKPVWSVGAAAAWSAVRLPNGNTLIGAHEFAREVNPAGTTVWEVGHDQIPGIQLNLIQEVSRLDNGDTLINNWIANQPQSSWPGSPQVIELSPQKQIRWVLSDWANLGPASATQILDKGVHQWR